MAKLTKQQASARTKKGWRKRKRAAKITAASLAIGKGNAARRRYKYQYTWQRPNKQDIPIRGFTPKQIEKMKPGLSAIDTHTQLRRKADLSSIERRGLSGRHRNVMGYYKRGNKKISLTKVGLSDPSTVMVHEFAHALDKDFNLSHSYAKPAGWTNRRARKVIRQPATMKNVHEKGKYLAVPVEGFKKRRGYKGLEYQATKVHEDLAETYTSHVIKRAGAQGFISSADRRKGVGHGIQAVQHTPARDKWMYQHMIAHDTIPRRAVVHENWGAHEHVDKMIIGGAVLAAAGYGVYKYKKDPEFKKRVDRARRRIQPGR